MNPVWAKNDRIATLEKKLAKKRGGVNDNSREIHVNVSAYFLPQRK